jgi:hypothetical protein
MFKDDSLKILEKVVFCVWDGQSMPLGQTVYGPMCLLNICGDFSSKIIEKNHFWTDDL